MQPSAEQHRLQQLAARAELLGQLLNIWRVTDPTRYENLLPRWEAMSAEIVRRHRIVSAEIANRYVYVARTEAGVTGPAPRVPAPPLDAAALRRDLSAKVRQSVRVSRKRRAPAQDVSRAAFIAAAGVASKAGLDAGRDVVVTSVQEDPKAIGWCRVTDGDPCAFCAMLASRGAVYRSNAESSGGFASHEHCGCTPAAVYRGEDFRSPQAEEFLRQYRESTAGYPRSKAFNAFRRAHEAHRRNARQSAAEAA